VAISADPDAWTRQTAAGDVDPLESGWRQWLVDLDAAAAGRWRSAASVKRAPRDRITTLRLASAGRVVVIRLDGATVQVEGSSGTDGDGSQAALERPTADALHAAARRLAR
jgi:hypothetical protein